MTTLSQLGAHGAASHSLGHSLVWALFNASKDQSIKFKIGPFPVSIRIEKLRPLVEKWVGPETQENADNVASS